MITTRAGAQVAQGTTSFVTPPNPVFSYLRGRTERWADVGTSVEQLKQQFAVLLEGEVTEITTELFERLNPQHKEVGISLYAYKSAVRVERVSSNFHTTAYSSTAEYYSRVGHYTQPGIPTGVLDKSPYSWAETALVEINAS